MNKAAHCVAKSLRGFQRPGSRTAEDVATRPWPQDAARQPSRGVLFGKEN